MTDVNDGKHTENGAVSDMAELQMRSMSWYIDWLPANGMGGLLVKLEHALDAIANGTKEDDLTPPESYLLNVVQNARRLAG